MKLDKLEKANLLSKEIKRLELIQVDSINAKCEWIQFTFGNGSNSPSVCIDADTIDKVRALIIEENKAKLSKLQTEFENL